MRCFGAMVAIVVALLWSGLAAANPPPWAGNGHGHAYGRQNGRATATATATAPASPTSTPVVTAPATAPATAPQPATPSPPLATTASAGGHGNGHAYGRLKHQATTQSAAPAPTPSAPVTPPAQPAVAPVQTTPTPAAPAPAGQASQPQSHTPRRTHRTRAHRTARHHTSTGRITPIRSAAAVAGVVRTRLHNVPADPAGPTQLVAPAATVRPHVAGTKQSTHPATRVRHAAATSPTAAAVKILSKLVRVIPPIVWIALGIALAIALISGLGTLLAARRARRERLALVAMREAALTDQLTGVLNRRGFIEAAERELARAERYGRTFALAYVDIRGLKAVNDSHGHRAGDELLRHAAHVLTDSARADDVVGRLGGDELALLLPEQTSGGASALADRIHDQLPARRAEIGLETQWDLTIGTAAFPEDGEDLDELLRVADRRLYEQRGVALRGA